MDFNWPLFLTIGYALLTWAYGFVCYNEGRKHGIHKGIVVTGTAIMDFLYKTNVIGRDPHGNIFRINDTGERGEVILENDENRA